MRGGKLGVLLHRLRVLAIAMACLTTAAFTTASHAQNPSVEARQRIALLIGMEKYDDPDLAALGLQNVGRDLHVLEGSFKRTGFTTEIVTNLTAADLRAKLKAFALEARKAHDATIYFTGFGVQVGGVDYIGGTDVSVDLGKRPADLEAAGFVSIKDLAVALQSTPGFRMIFAEAGRSDIWSEGAQRGFSLVTKDAAEDADVLIFYGSQSGGGSSDGPEGGNGPFAGAVARNMVEPGMEIGLFIRRVRAEVARETEGAQRPELYGELGYEAFYFAGQNTESAKPPPVFSKQPRLALVIGNSDYDGNGTLDEDDTRAVAVGLPADLMNPRNDASDIKNALETLKFDVTLVQDADFEALSTALFAFEDKIKSANPNAIVVIYYAGHAIQVGGGNYLLPVRSKLPDVDLDRIPPAQAELLISRVALPVQTSLLERLKSPEGDGLNLVILDACRENPWERLVITRGVGGRGRGVGNGRFRGLGEVRIDLRRTAIAFATKPGDVAADGKGRNSPYATAFLRHVAEPGVSVIEMLNRVGEQVETDTDRRQVPWTNSPALGRTCLGACEPLH